MNMTVQAPSAQEIAPTPVAAPIVAPRSPELRIRKAQKHTKKLERRLEQAEAQGGYRKIRAARDRLIRSFDAKIVAFAESAKRLKTRPRARDGKSPSQPRPFCRPEGPEIIALAAEVSAVRAPNCRVTVTAVNKPKNQEFRPIYSLNIRDKARQRLVMRAIKSALPVTEIQYGTKHGGRKEAIARVTDALALGEYKYGVTCDIKNFFPCVDRDWLRQSLPIGDKVTTSTLLVDDDYQRFLWKGWGTDCHCLSDISLGDACQSGLPQGACSSPMIADWIVGRILSDIQLSAGCLMVNYADNFVILGRRKADVEHCLHTLRDASGRHPAGNLHITDDGIRRVCDGFEFLGYALKRRRDLVTVKPTKKNGAKIAQHVLSLVARIYHGQDAAIAKLKAALRSWQNAFAAWAGVNAFVWRTIEDYARALPEIGAELRSTVINQRKALRKAFEAA